MTPRSTARPTGSAPVTLDLRELVSHFRTRGHYLYVHGSTVTTVSRVIRTSCTPHRRLSCTTRQVEGKTLLLPGFPLIFASTTWSTTGASASVRVHTFDFIHTEGCKRFETRTKSLSDTCPCDAFPADAQLRSREQATPCMRLPPSVHPGGMDT
ncbi:hypothetical protein PHLGIDRAFT_284538 [Phlebiopsis gigantea 11061_1 CR5-6]|uniref:Uncharacterized protein n=1 Tax=Phlebiopsis gigantea (strain 11061_1 CR5-6) TaxID=745531 RepID=A0A0C3RRF7_PHLG1|nr:hypothetical protein PHLGIDRAFT_284538 [Phlebiopsis gigantea 11061_1 CR5-6]